MNIAEKIKQNGLVAIIRGNESKSIIPIANALQHGGIKTIEITVETPNALELIKELTVEFGDEMVIGAGTVLDPETARAAIMSGAQFVFSPTTNPETIKMTKRYGTVSIPGAFTPTEILTAYEHGADIVKVFPASIVGPKFLKDLQGPLPHIPLMPTGGINLENIGEYIKVGGVAVGLGSSLVDMKKEMTEAYLSNLSVKAASFVAELNKARGKNNF